MTARVVRVCICAGEPSGDRHAAALVRALRAQRPGASVDAVGGPALAAAGARLIASIDRLAVMGYQDPITRLIPHLRLLARLRRRFRERLYDLVILVDYPGFHLRVAQAAAAAGLPVLYYLAPQVWAWGERRAEVMRRTVCALAVGLPFEEAFFRRRGVSTRYVGHPSLDEPYLQRREARRILGVAPAAPIVGVFPGSRRSEVQRLWPLMREAVRRLRTRRPDLTAVVAAMEGYSYPDADGFQVRPNAARTVLAAADAALCKSGSITLEAAGADVPHVIAYATDPVSYLLARRMIRIPFVGLVNILAGRPVVPELLQGDARPDALAGALVPLLDRAGAPAREQRAAFAQIRARLGPPGAARRTAEMAWEIAS